MHRRQFLRAAATSGAAAALALSPRGSAAHPANPDGGNAATATGTPTPTDAVATPTSGYEPLGSVDVEGATEAVVTPDGGTAFVATGDGFAAVDLTDPADPTVTADERDISPPGTDQVMGGIYDVKYGDGELLVAGPANYDPGSFYGVALYDVSDPGSPEFLRAHETAFPIHNCYLADGHAYLTGNNRDDNPLVVVDVGSDGPAEVGRWSLPAHDDAWAAVPSQLRTLHDVWVRDGRAYLAHWDAGTWILDVSDPANPEYVADVRERSPEELAAIDGLAVAREASEPPGNDHYVATGRGGDLLAVGKETWNSNFGKEGTTPGPDDPGGPSGIDLYDLSDPQSPERLATIDPPPTADPNYRGVRTTAHNFEIADGYLYSSWYRGGVKVHDVSDPANPEEVRYFRRSSTTSFWTARLATPGEAVVATSYYDPSDLDAPATLYTFPDVDRPTATPTPEPTTAPETADATASPGSTTAPGGSAASTGTGNGTGTGEADGTETGDGTAGGGPGFGPFAALAGLGVGAWRLLGGRERGDAED